VWCTITNFGGKQYMEGKLLRVLTEPQRAAKSIAGSTIKGVGIIPEAIENNSIVYQWTLDGAWQREITPVQKRVEEFVKARYGANDKHLVEAWQYLLQSVYITHSTVQAGGYESIFCGRPDSALISTISCCGPANRIYDVEILFQAAMNFAAVAGKYQNNESFRFDLVDIWRQLINLKGREAYDAMMFSLKQKKLQNFQLNKNRFITLLTLQDKWTGTHPQFRVGSWINKAKDMLPGESDKKMAEWNARTQITYWGNDNPETDLHESAAKEWNGILKDLYLQRWIRFFEWAEAKLEGRSIPYPDFFAMEKQWTLQTNPYSSDADGNMIAILPEIIKELKEEIGK
jgi:alpha-N-acetylglucosaminidase